MKLYRPSHILFGLIFIGITYAGYAYYEFGTFVIIALAIIGASNLYYAFTDPQKDLPGSKYPAGYSSYLFFKASQQFFKDANKDKELMNEINKKVLICPKCKVEEKIFNLSNRKDSSIMIYNEKNPRVRKKDGLNIFPMICFNCKTMTEFATNPLNSSKNAIKGIEYFKTRKINQKDKKEALNFAESNNNEILIKKLKKYNVKFL